MKIGIILPRTQTGEYRYGNYLIGELNRKGIDIEVLNNEIPLIGGSPTIKMIFGSLFLARYLKKEKINVVHNIDNLPPYLFVSNKFKRKVKLIVTVHDIAPVVLSKIHSIIMNFHFKVPLPVLLKNSTHIIVPSHSTKRDLLEYLISDSSKIVVIPMGIDTSKFYPRKSTNKIKQKYDINYPLILYAGTENPRKNLERLIIAYNKISHEIPHRLVLVGPITQKTIIKILRKHNIPKDILKRITLLGYLPDEELPYLYTLADVFVYPSLYEGFGFPPLEAMACGTPVVTSNISSIPEVVGKAAVLVNPLNTDEIAFGILRILEDRKLRKRLVHFGRRYVKKYSWKKTADKTEKVYKN